MLLPLFWAASSSTADQQANSEAIRLPSGDLLMPMVLTTVSGSAEEPLPVDPAAPRPVDEFTLRLAPGDIVELSYFKSYSPKSSYELRVGDQIQVEVSRKPPGPEYILAEGDALEIVVHLETALQAQQRAIVGSDRGGRAELREAVTVLPDGRLSLPWIGSVELRGKTVDQARTALTELYRRHFRQATVDVLVLKAWAPAVRQTSSVLPDGRVTLPLVGSVALAGLSADEAADELEKLFRSYVPQPQVDVLVTESRAQLTDFFEILSTAPEGPTRTVMVNEEGLIGLPLIGTLQAGGRTLVELGNEIVRAYALVLPDLRVDTVLKKRRPRWITILGEVNRDGSYEASRPVTPLEALAMGGGLTDRARRSQVLLIRPAEDGSLNVKALDLKKALRDAARTEGYQRHFALVEAVHPGDILYVPRSRIGNVNVFVEQYIRALLPFDPAIGIGWNLNR